MCRSCTISDLITAGILKPDQQQACALRRLIFFETTTLDGDLTYTKDVKDQYTRLDFGLTGGVGYKTKRILKSMAFGVNYYYGLVNVSKTPDVTMKNSSVYFYMKLPIGLGADEPKK